MIMMMMMMHVFRQLCAAEQCRIILECMYAVSDR